MISPNDIKILHGMFTVCAFGLLVATFGVVATWFMDHLDDIADFVLDLMRWVVRRAVGWK